MCLVGCLTPLFQDGDQPPDAEPKSFSDPCSLLSLFTVNSKAEVRFHLATADWIAEPVRQKMAITVTTGPLLFL